jgi:hypothetical protein
MNKNFAKVRLSAEEMRLVTDPAWILTKNSVMGKVVAMFAELSEVIRAGGAHRVAPLRRAPSSGGKEPKISKGENYKGLPWVMLDYPREFGREDVYAIRLFFLWGYAFSVTLHLKGEYMRVFLPMIMDRREELSAAGFERAISADEWAHEHTQETYGPLSEAGDVRAAAGKGEAGGERSWLKLSARVGLEHWDEAPERLSMLYSLLLEVMATADRDLSGDDESLSGDDHR